MSSEVVPDPSSECVLPPDAGEALPSHQAQFSTPHPAMAGNPTVALPPGECGSQTRGNPTLLGYQFDDFELVAELGQGGMGIVYQARQISLDRIVAIKMLRKEHFENPTVVQRFLSEARAVAALDHPNIVKIYQIGKCPAGQYFVMEFVDGQPLEALLFKGPLPIGGSTLLLQRVAEALHYAHGKGIIHRDLKPANIIINKFGQPIVLDFGIVKFMNQDAGLTQEGMIIGTPTYLPPEQTGEGSTIKPGPFSDVYSLGAILYTMLTGRVPFPGDNALEVLVQVMSPEPPTSLRALRPEVPAALERICLKCLRKKPESRYPTAKALADDLRRFRNRHQRSASAGNSSLKALPPVVLVVVETGQRVRLAGSSTLLGRAPECDILLKAPAVSKQHCKIRWSKGQASIEDLDSSNGTWVNGKRIRRCRLKDGTRLEIGGHRFLVRIAKPK
jgi:serine/threonine protein kinase